MKTKLLTLGWSGVMMLALFACASTPSEPVADAGPSPHPAAESRGPDVSMLPEGCRLGAAVEVDGATIWAVVDADAPAETDYLTLDEAMELGICTVRETGAAAPSENGDSAEGDQPAEVSGDVNTLLVSNTGDRPIFLMAGDLVLGGKQDRILAGSVVVDPGAADLRISVFCVEHGRWTPQAKDGGKAAEGYFTNDAERGQADIAVKKAALECASQSAVWSTVAESNARLGVDHLASSGTFRSTFDSEETAAKIEANMAMARKLSGPQVVGYLVCVENEPAAMDVFESAGLCQKLSEKLLRSYVVTGISGGYEIVAEEPEPTTAGQESGFSGGEINPPVNLNEAIHLEELAESEGQCVEQRAVQTNVRGNYREHRPIVSLGEQEDTPNARTKNRRVVEEKAVHYECEDAQSGRAVQKSYLRR